MKKLVWIDDIRNPEIGDWLMSYAGEFAYGDGEVTWVKTYDEFIDEVIKNGLPDMIAFDNDLGEEKYGLDCAKWLVGWCLDNKVPLPKWTVQSANPVAAEHIHKLLENFKKFQENEDN